MATTSRASSVPDPQSPTWTFPAAAGGCALQVYGNGSVSVRADPAVTALTVRQVGPGLPSPSLEAQEGTMSLRIGDLAAAMFGSSTDPTNSFVDVRIPAATADRFPVSLMARHSTVQLVGAPGHPVHVGEVMAIQTEVTGGHVRLLEGDKQVKSGDRTAGALDLTEVDLGDAAHMVQAHGGARVALGCTGSGTLHIKLDSSGTQEPDIRGTRWVLHGRPGGPQTMPAREPRGAEHGLGPSR